MSKTQTEFTIEPPKRWLSVNWKELYRYRDLFLVLAWRDIAVRYKQTALGVLWAILQPIITMVVFTFIFNRVGKIPSGSNIPYPIFLYVGLLFWMYFSGALSTASNSMVTNSQLISKIYFPRLIIPATAITTGLVDLGISSLVLVCMMIYYGFTPSLIGIAILPLLILCVVLYAMGMGLYMAAINVKYRDVRYALPFFIRIMEFVTPVVYPLKMLDAYPVAKALMLWLNPLSGVISNARAGILGHSPIEWNVLGISLLMSFVFFIFGLYYFRNTERFFADIV